MLHPEYLDIASGPIGRVVTSEEQPASLIAFFVLAEGECPTVYNHD